jgi:uncharacterized BrkB/YihY/UPF0761 family membrane protein
MWKAHRSTEMAASLAFYAALASAGLSLVAVYVAAHVPAHGPAAAKMHGQTVHVAGTGNAQILQAALHEAASRHDAWIALVAGALIFLAAIVATAFLTRVAKERVQHRRVHSSG